jgi:phage terminase large subunit-like protein
MVSIGAFEKGPIAPDTNPITMVWYDGSSPASLYFG